MDTTAMIISDITEHIGHVMEVRNIPHTKDGRLEQLFSDYYGAYLDFLQEHEVGSYREFQPESEHSVEGELLFDRDGELLKIPFCLEDFT